jgi:hypothetical protein
MRTSTRRFREGELMVCKVRELTEISICEYVADQCCLSEKSLRALIHNYLKFDFISWIAAIGAGERPSARLFIEVRFWPASGSARLAGWGRVDWKVWGGGRCGDAAACSADHNVRNTLPLAVKQNASVRWEPDPSNPAFRCDGTHADGAKRARCKENMFGSPFSFGPLSRSC